ncbi:MAG: hypothetical protein AAF998_22155 [Bacteroidota bacterium]
MTRQINTILLATVWMLSAAALLGQAPEYEYFPPDLMATLAVEEVVEFQTEVTDPQDLVASGKRIRLARDIRFRLRFDTLGQKAQKRLYRDGGQAVHDQIDYQFDRRGRLVRTTYLYPQPANVLAPDDSTAPPLVIRHERRTQHVYLITGKPAFRLVHTVADSTVQLTDSIHFVYDVLDRRSHKIRYTFRDSTRDSLVYAYTHFARGMRIAKMIGDQVAQREILRYDTEGRMISREYYNGNDAAPRMREVYTYDQEGRLNTIDFIRDWNFFDRGASLVQRQNTYDGRGKLSESVLEYGDGRRILKFYDYTYLSGE